MKKNIKKNIQANTVHKKDVYEQEHKKEITRAKLIKQFFIIVLVVTIFMGSGVAFTHFVLNPTPSTKPDTNDKTDEIYNATTILAGESFGKTDKEYMVLFSNGTCGTACTEVDSTIKKYVEAVDKAVPTYKVNMDDRFNKQYLYDWDKHKEEFGTEDTEAKININPANVNELQIAEYPTLLVFKDGKLEKFLMNKDVKTYIESLIPAE